MIQSDPSLSFAAIKPVHRGNRYTAPVLRLATGAVLALLLFNAATVSAQTGAGGGTPPSGPMDGGAPGGSGGPGGATVTTVAITGVNIGAYHLESVRPYSDTLDTLIYTTSAINTNTTPYTYVLGTVTSSSPKTVVVAGSVEFGSLPALGKASGTTTFMVRQARHQALDPSVLNWSFVGASSTSTVGTGASSISVHVSRTVVAYGQAIDLTAKVSPTSGTGTVTFFDGPVPLGTSSLSAGTATLSAFTLPSGRHDITAMYSGDTTYAASTSREDNVNVFAAGAVDRCSHFKETQKVVCLAQAFESTLTSAQVATLQLSYTLTNAEHWSNLPLAIVARNGLDFGSLTSVQLAAALELARAAMSSEEEQDRNEESDGGGYGRLQKIRGADNLLSGLNSSFKFGAGNYFVAFYGTPSSSSPWQLQFAGHHFAFNHTFNGKFASGTPYFLGTEPTIYDSNGTLYKPLEGPRSASFDVAQSVYGNSSALLSGSFDDVVMSVGSGGTDTNYPQTYPSGTTGRGIPYASLQQYQKQQVKTMIEAWVKDMDAATAQDLLRAYEEPSALAQTYVGYAGTGNLTVQGDYIRIDGPRVWIEFVVQNGVVFTSSYHFHTIWRDKAADYGGDFSGS